MQDMIVLKGLGTWLDPKQLTDWDSTAATVNASLELLDIRTCRLQYYSPAVSA